MNKKLFFIRKNKIIIFNLLLILILIFSIINLFNQKEELKNVEMEIVSINNNNLRNTALAKELEDLIELSNENGYVKEDRLVIKGDLLNDFSQSRLVITEENLSGNGLEYRKIEGYGDGYSMSRLFNIISKKYNLAFEILELKIWPEANNFQFYIKYDLDMNNWIGREPELSSLDFRINSQNKTGENFSGDRYYYQGQPGFNDDSDRENAIVDKLPGHIVFKGFIKSQGNEFFLFEINNQAVIFQLDQEEIFSEIKYFLYYDNGLFLMEDLLIYRIGEK
ncbi:hypothetical protein I0Q91_10820 [Halanaerobiaceae bacterium Z-7014]|uniref:Uncharacterized protein n=1 Tax=Halonatronomonas betaini TaxID=2778430 RepID=A0A931FB37_9FIRM|nr:hypothetical protein [Halonatronomonas betaini]MBF8437577.1 hypothetical protein [Halonatronomonas betaini]